MNLLLAAAAAAADITEICRENINDAKLVDTNG